MNRLGTLGFFARSPDGGVWIVSATHVLERATRRVVAVHTRGKDSGSEVAHAVSVLARCLHCS